MSVGGFVLDNILGRHESNLQHYTDMLFNMHSRITIMLFK
jgi:hypothetical protein